MKKLPNSLLFKKIALPLHRFSSPDGGIGRRAGLKHQWGNTRAGSTPALGTLESANRLFFKWLAFFFVKNSPLLPHLHKKLVLFAEF